MTSQQVAAFLHKTKDVRVGQHGVGEPLDHEVLVAIANAGICGSDAHFYNYGRIGDVFVLSERHLPAILGHEGSGTVIKVGKDVTDLQIGDRVVMEPGISCLTCAVCRTGKLNHCSRIQFQGIPPHPGYFKQYHCHPANFIHKIPDNMSFEEGALVQPVTIALQAAKLTDLKIGQNILICGAGTIGLAHLLIAKAYGASKITVAEVDEHRLSVAKDIGADHVFLVKQGLSARELAKQISLEAGEEPDITFECSGAEISTQMSIYVTRPGGTVALVGVGSEDMMKVPMITASIRELKLTGVVRGSNCFPLAISLISSGRIDVKPLISHRFKLSEAPRAMEVASARGNNAVKVLLSCKV